MSQLRKLQQLSLAASPTSVATTSWQTFLWRLFLNIFLYFCKCEIYLYELTNVFVQIAKCIRLNSKNIFFSCLPNFSPHFILTNLSLMALSKNIFNAKRNSPSWKMYFHPGNLQILNSQKKIYLTCALRMSPKCCLKIFQEPGSSWHVVFWLQSCWKYIFKPLQLIALISICIHCILFFCISKDGCHIT